MEGNITNEQILALTNTQKRMEFLETWPQWPVLAAVPELGLVVRQVKLPRISGKRILSLEYGERNKIVHNESFRTCYFQVLNMKSGISPFNDTGTANVISTLKNLRMEIVAQRKEAKS